MFFSDDEADTYFNESGNLIVPELQDGILRLNITAGSDPNIYIFASEDASTLLAEEYPVLLFKVKRSEGSPLTGQFFFNTGDFSGPSASGAVSFAYEDTTDWQMIAVNLGSNTNYTGELISVPLRSFLDNGGRLHDRNRMDGIFPFHSCRQSLQWGFYAV